MILIGQTVLLGGLLDAGYKIGSLGAVLGWAIPAMLAAATIEYVRLRASAAAP